MGRPSAGGTDLSPQDAPGALLPLELRTVRLGMQVTLIAPLAAAACFALSGYGRLRMGPNGALFTAVATAAAVANLLPWKRLFRAGWGMGFLYAWSAVNTLLITLGIWATGGQRSQLLFLYAVTTVFFAVAFPPRAQLALFAFTVSCYAAILGVGAWDVLPLTTLGILAFLSGFLSKELRSRMAAQAEAHAEAERRWALAAKVSVAARTMSMVEPTGVLRAVVDSIAGLGYDASRLYVRPEGEGPWESAVPQDPRAPTDHTIEALPLEARRALLEGARTVISTRDPVEPVPAGGPGHGLRTVVATPVVVGDRVDAVLLVGSTSSWEPSPQEVEVFEMLAAHASQALQNAARFEEQRRAMERMAELDRMKSDFLSTVSHELRTPLTVISGMGLTLQRQWEALDDETRQDLLTRLNANAQTLQGIIGSLLDFSRLEAGRLEVAAEQVPVAPLVEGLVARLESLLQSHDVTVDVDAELWVRADHVLMERIFENLLSNAVKYTPPGSHVCISATRDGGDGLISVRDDGPGIPQDELVHLSERFFRGGDPNTRTTRGTGLGLALVAEILELHGSSLEIESVVGAGSRFAFRLPISLPTAPAERPDRTSVPSAVAALLSTGEDRHGDLSPSLGARGSGMFDDTPFDSVLIAAQSGAEWAIAALYREFSPRILRYIRARTAGASREVASAAWSDIAAGLARFEGDMAEFRRWIFTVARRRVGESGRGLSAPSGGIRPSRPPAHGADSDLSSTSVDEALDVISRLPPEQADVVLLRVVADLSIPEIARVTGKRLGAVRTLEQKGLERLREFCAAPQGELVLSRGA